MALTSSTMLPLGTRAPDFSLPDVTTGQAICLADFANADVLVVMFICNHCPYVKHVAPELAALSRDYQYRNVAMVGICSNDVAVYPDDAPDQMAVEKRRRGYLFPYLYDESQEVAKAYRAACTPDFYVFDSDRRLAYCGRLDETRPTRISSGNYDSSRSLPNGRELRSAIESLLAGNRPSSRQFPSMGCNIKWKPGNEPVY